MEKVKSFTNDQGRTFNVRILLDGDQYGRDDCLTWNHDDNEHFRGAVGVEFWDATHPHTELGQFTGGRYFADTILFVEKWTPEKGFHHTGEISRNGLCLHGGEPVWTIDPVTMGFVRIWILEQLAKAGATKDAESTTI
jgi:hypothetical protein